MISKKEKSIKVTVTLTENVADVIRQAKINRIYDILTKHETA